MLASADVVIRLINDLLLSSRVLSDKFELACSWQKSTTLFESCLKIVTIRCAAKKIKFTPTLRLNDFPKYLFVDNDRLLQVLTNVLENAIKFTNPHGQITLNISAKVGQLDHNQMICHKEVMEMKERGSLKSVEITMVVTDTGIGLFLFVCGCQAVVSNRFLYPGIKQEALPNLFEPFVQADPSISRNYGGSVYLSFALPTSLFYFVVALFFFYSDLVWAWRFLDSLWFVSF
jgi:signal transduction histidine kinase